MEEDYDKEIRKLLETCRQITSSVNHEMRNISEDCDAYTIYFKDAINSLTQAKAEENLSMALMIGLKSRASKLLKRLKTIQAFTRDNSRKLHDLKEKVTQILNSYPFRTPGEPTPTAINPIAAVAAIATATILYFGYMFTNYFEERKIRKQGENLEEMNNVATRIEMALEEFRYKNCDMISKINEFMLKVGRNIDYSVRSFTTSNTQNFVRIVNDTIAVTAELRNCYEDFIADIKCRLHALQL
ncbi:hypothetical protein INT47_008026 [Mucor saturninus]|uniref:Uncharacterized protein n=1 Tax=Mucor saturninus TaxID=64648 RepID=A0A8H7V3C1_9FUNG|nr:hypothetical protein INT47_008026 [Mucor saturninus]